MSLKEHWGREKAAFHQIKDTDSFCNFGARFLLTSFDRSCFMLRPSCGLTAASFMDKNWEMPGESCICSVHCLCQMRKGDFQYMRFKMNHAYLHLPLQRLDIVDDLVQHHCLPSDLNRSKPNPAPKKTRHYS
jgi:hypothetical protein